MNLKKFIKYIVINIFLLITIYFLYLNNIRVCLVYNIFNVPCVGCGLTRSVYYLFKLDFVNSLKYNLIGIPLVLVYTIVNIWYIIDLIKNKNSLKIFIDKYKKYILGLVIFIFIISSIKNFFNPLLYNI